MLRPAFALITFVQLLSSVRGEGQVQCSGASSNAPLLSSYTTKACTVYSHSRANNFTTFCMADPSGDTKFFASTRRYLFGNGYDPTQVQWFPCAEQFLSNPLRKLPGPYYGNNCDGQRVIASYDFRSRYTTNTYPNTTNAHCDLQVKYCSVAGEGGHCSSMIGTSTEGSFVEFRQGPCVLKPGEDRGSAITFQGNEIRYTYFFDSFCVAMTPAQRVQDVVSTPSPTPTPSPVRNRAVSNTAREHGFICAALALLLGILLV